MNRPTFQQACNQYPHRFTAEHVPTWARKSKLNGEPYRPHFKTDAEWYANTVFPGEPEHPDYPHRSKYCYTRNHFTVKGQS